MSADLPWLTVREGTAPLIIGLPHTGTEIPARYERGLVSSWLARKDADWWVDELYSFAADLGATIVRTAISRTVIDVNRDPSGVSLYPGQATTELCPTTTFDGEALYRPGCEPDEAEVDHRKQTYFDPYHQALIDQTLRLRELHDHVVLYDAHSIRSRIPRLFDGLLPHFNIGTNEGKSCSPVLMRAVCAASEKSNFSHVANGRFKGGYTTRHHGWPETGIHAIQMELACRGYMGDPETSNPETWPTPYDPAVAAPMRAALTEILTACLAFAKEFA
jgi:N-formylglutamate deformylase